MRGGDGHGEAGVEAGLVLLVVGAHVADRVARGDDPQARGDQREEQPQRLELEGQRPGPGRTSNSSQPRPAAGEHAGTASAPTTQEQRAADRPASRPRAGWAGGRAATVSSAAAQRQRQRQRRCAVGGRSRRRLPAALSAARRAMPARTRSWTARRRAWPPIRTQVGTSMRSGASPTGAAPSGGGPEVGHLDHAPDVDQRQQRADQHQRRHRPAARPPARARIRYHLLMKPAVSGTPIRPSPPSTQADHGPAASAGRARAGPSISHRAEAQGDAAHGQEQPALHQGVVEQVHDAAGEAGDRGEADAQHHVADLRHAGVGQHALDVRSGRSPPSRRRRSPTSASGSSIASSGIASKANVGAEDGEDEAQQDVDRDLGRRGGQERGDHRGRVGVGVGQPEVQREQRHLEADADGEEARRRPARSGCRHDRGQPLRPCRPCSACRSSCTSGRCRSG